MSRKISLLILSTICALALIFAFPINFSAHAAVGDIHESFDGISLRNDIPDGDNFGNWKVYKTKEDGKVYIVDDPTGANRGHVLRLYNPNQTFLHIGYNGYTAKNYTVEYDFYGIAETVTKSEESWAGLYARTKDINLSFDQTNTFLMLFMTAPGQDGDEITVDGGTRPATPEDTCYGFHPDVSEGSVGQMDHESGSSEEFGYIYRTGGGQVKGAWFTVKFEVRDNLFSGYIKEAGADEWYFCGTGAYTGNNENLLSAGQIGLGVCTGDFYFDNFHLYNEDGQIITATCVDASSDFYGDARAKQSTAGANTSVELVLAPEEGGKFVKWYKDTGKMNEVVPETINIQQRLYDEEQRIYEWENVLLKEEDGKIQVREYDYELKDYVWLDINLTAPAFTAFSDLKKDVATQKGGIPADEYFAGENFRLVVRANTAVNGYNFYGELAAENYLVYATYATETDGEEEKAHGSISATGFVQKDGDLYTFKKYQSDVTITATPDAGYAFAGWYELIYRGEEVFRTRVSSHVVLEYTVDKSDIKFIAVFVESGKATYSLQFSKDVTDQSRTDYGEIKTVSGNYREGEKMSLIALPAEGFILDGWYKDGVWITDEPYYNFTDAVSESGSYVAMFAVESYRIIISNGFGVEKDPIETEKDATVTLVADGAPKGFKFTGWLVYLQSGKLIDNVTQDLDTRTVVFTASDNKIFAVPQYDKMKFKVTVKYNNIKYGTVSGAGEYVYGSVVELTPRSNEGYVISEYTVKGAEANITESGACVFVMPSEDVIIRVTFTPVDKIETNKEQIAFLVIMIVAVLGVGVMLFRKRKKKD